MTKLDTVKKTLKSFAACEFGATSIEYAFIALLVSTAIIGGVSATGSAVSENIDGVSNVWPD